MNIEKIETDAELTISLAGRLDTTTAPSLETVLKESLGNKSMLIFDFSKVEYISSAGLRVLLSSQKIMNRQGTMIVKNANQAVKDVFEMTGFCDILTIE